MGPLNIKTQLLSLAVLLASAPCVPIVKPAGSVNIHVYTVCTHQRGMPLVAICLIIEYWCGITVCFHNRVHGGDRR